MDVNPNIEQTEQPIKTGVAIPKQPNQNLMIFEQIEGCCEIIAKLLGELMPKTTHVDDCIITHKAWLDHNIKHLKGAFE